MATASMSDWAAKAAFMREHGALHAEWAPSGELVRLTLGPAPVTRIATTPEPKKDGPAKRLLEMHKTQFLASRMKPPFREPAKPEAVVPRAVRAKEAAAARGSTKNQKRNS